MQWETRDAWTFNHPRHVLMRLTPPAMSQYIEIRLLLNTTLQFMCNFSNVPWKVFIFPFHQVILRFVMGEEAVFSMNLLLDCNIFIIHVLFPSVMIFLPNSHGFSKANYDASGFSFFPHDDFAWLLHSTTFQRQAEMLSGLFIVRKPNGKLITVPHSVF